MSHKNAIPLWLIFAASVAAQNVLPEEQNWKPEVRHGFWFIDQGSRIMPLSWFQKLERANSEEKFAAGLDRFGFVIDEFGIPGDLNKAGLPIGFSVSKRVPGEQKPGWVGLTCSACHSGLIKAGTRRIFIEGGPAMFDFDRFLSEMVDAMTATLNDGAKRGRFLNGMPAGTLADFKEEYEKLALRREVNTPPSPAGFARVDAFGHIFNQVIVQHLGNDKSKSFPPDAPASYPALWDIARHRYVQWNRSAPNLGSGASAAGSLIRNIGEVVGVFGDVAITKSGWFGALEYQSSAKYDNLKTIEGWLLDLRAPKWPFDKPDQQEVRAGQKLYQEHCVGCHAIITSPFAPVVTYGTPLKDVGTDPNLARNFLGREAPSRILQGVNIAIRPREFFSTFGPTAKAAELTGHIAARLGASQTNPLISVLGAAQVFYDGPQDLEVYKARPLNGIWATAPYLHNGSVPTLSDLLKVPSSRSAKFCVGDGEYDIEDVGFKTYVDSVPDCPKRTTLFDTSIPGNRNIGHLYGTTLGDTQKRQLIAYLKTL